MTRAFHLTLVLALTCAVSGAGKIAHCFDHRGYESAAERSSDYVHGHHNKAMRGQRGSMASARTRGRLGEALCATTSSAPLARDPLRLGDLS